MGADAAARAVLTRVQQELPVCERPYGALGEACGTDEAGAFAAVEAARAEGLIRRIGASFESSRIGYASTLAALAVPPEEIDRVAALVGAHPGITHNYERDDRYNLWFTLVARSKEARDAELARIVSDSGCDDLLVLPAVRLFKIKVAFDVREKGEAADAEGAAPAPARAPLEPAQVAPVPLDDADRALIRALQDDLGGTLRPFALAAKVASGHAGRALSEEWAVARTRELLEAGAIRRFGAMVRHRRMGFSSNAMGVWDVPEEQALAAGEVLARPAAVSHCYERPRSERWPYNLYTMIHGRDRETCERVAAELHADLAAAGIDVAPPRLLLSTREFKKTSMRYFEEDL
ncbi:siroheme decarboxylase subunit beta [Arabiibacter massiliensis]|uniref:siroheme decarboxylase subunit beta n=1 Tax=Arabiibacter massiliensis TaxID=1870985 RepID=UPI0009BC3948|nr:Lrp/AsnC family transcriptional regulator [Arabiibacter massiliensis]